MLLYNMWNIYKYNYYTYILLKMQKPNSIYRDYDHDSRLRRFIPRSQMQLTFIIIYTICYMYFNYVMILKLSLVTNQIMLPQKCLASYIGDILFCKLLIGLCFYVFYTTLKIIQMFHIFTVFTHKKLILIKKNFLCVFWRHQIVVIS